MPGSHPLFSKQNLCECSHIFPSLFPFCGCSRCFQDPISCPIICYHDIMLSSVISFIAVLVCTQTVGYWMDMPANSSVSPLAPCFRGDRLSLLFSGFPSPWLAEGLLLFLFPSQRKAVIHLRSFPQLSPVPSSPEDWVSCVVLVSCFYGWDKYPPNDPWVKDLSLLRSSGAFRKCDPNERTLGYCRCPLTGTNKTLASLSPLSLLLGHCEVNNFLYHVWPHDRLCCHRFQSHRSMACGLKPLKLWAKMHGSFL